ncbi:hypothetical protein [Arenimonas fontis]|uniref:Uncharacterized protein n=1 Tax=Arenimonas fontis TaxID=2608255 RepID=A0A5B2ZCF4_9GAMM|nr:hypothetical protein [Arenimonas fontis]KAA2285595.1 hypothetical protein F0415_02855 [Arenimonas fontis]
MKTLSDFYRLFPARPALPARSSRPAVTTAADIPAPATSSPSAAPIRPDRYRERTVGRGYGRSSGYAAARSYVDGNGLRLVRVG